MSDQSISGYLKQSIGRSGVVGQLIAVNVAVFLLVAIIGVIGELLLIQDFRDLLTGKLGASTSLSRMIYQPWGIVTQLFTHHGFVHLLMNMIALYFIGRIFVQFFGERRLVTTYIVGGIFAFLFQVIGSNTIPYFISGGPIVVVGASGSIAAILVAAAAYRPQLKVGIPNVFSVPFIYVAIGFVLLDFFYLTAGDNVAHLVHLGGALFGWLSIRNISSPNQFMNRLDKLFTFNFSFKNIFKRKPKFKVYQGDVKEMTDEEFNANKSANEERINLILDKISEKGYDGLTKAEKEFLFKHSKR